MAEDGRGARGSATLVQSAPIEASLGTHGTQDERRSLEALLWYDLCSEYDARFYSAYLQSLPILFTPEFQAAEGAWAEDEARHFDELKTAFSGAFGWSGTHETALSSRRPDFGPLAHLFEDEFAILCLGAYDELVTVRAYRANRERYGRINSDVDDLVRRITADEGLHFRNFLQVLRQRHTHRFGEATRILERIRATEGVAYAATFVLDHDDPVFADWMYDEALSALLRRLR